MTYSYNLLTNRNWKVRAVQILNHMAFGYVLYSGIDWRILISIVVYFFMFCIGVDVGIHRYFSHKSFQSHAFGRYLMGICSCLATLGSPLAWAGMHRMHHRYSDTPLDPHTPVVNGKVTVLSFLRTYVGVWSRYTASPRYIKDIRKESLHKFMHFYYFGIIFSYIFLLSLFGFETVVYMYCIPAVFCFHAASWIVTVGHTFGDNSLKVNDFSRNNVILHWVTWGEGIHNQHHAAPKKDYYKTENWYFFDLPGFLIITFLKKYEKSPL